MKLKRIDVARLRGGRGEFAIDALSPGINLLLGPNGSGKSSLCLAIGEVLWPRQAPTSGARLSLQIDGEAGPLEAELDGRVTWRAAGGGEPIAPPRLPAPQLASASRVGLRDLLDENHPSDRVLAERIQVELAGGFDLRALRSPLSVRRHGRKEEQALVEAGEGLAELERQRRELAREDDRLAALREALGAAEDAERRARALRQACELAERRDELALLEARQRGLGVPAGALDALGGGEGEALAGLERELDEARSEREEEESIAVAAERRMLETGLPDGPPEPIVLDRLRGHVAGIQSLEEEQRRTEEELAGARAALAECERVLAGDLDLGRAELLGADELAQLTGWLEAAREQDARRAHLSASLGSEQGLGPEELEAERAALAHIAELIREWLDASAGPLRGAPALALLASGLLVAGMGALLAVHPDLWWPVGWHISSEDLRGLAGLLIGGGGAMVSIIGALSLRGVSRRRRIRRELSRRGQSALGARGVESARMQSALQVVEMRLAALARRIDEATLQRVTRRQLEALGVRDLELAERREALARAIGVDPGLADLTLGELGARVGRWSEAKLSLAELLGRADWLAGRATEVGDRLRTDLEKLPGDAPHDARSAAAIVADLDRRAALWQRSADEAGQAARRMEGLAGRIERLEEARSALFERAGVGAAAQRGDGRPQLEARLALLDPHRELRDARRLTEDRIAALERALENAPELRALSPDEAEARLAQADAAAAEIAQIAGELGGIESRVAAATRSRDLEAAAAGLATAREALAERRDELLSELAGDLLLDEVEAEFERSSRPAVLESASRLFSRFTDHRYTLDIDADGEDGPGRFVAVDSRTGRRAGPGQLSDGTRMQLLLAARLGFALSGEAGTSPPLFFDEALTASDPERFRAVAGCLIELAREGRQIFYATCDPQDVRQLESLCERAGAPAPHVVDLGALRTGAAGYRDAAVFSPSPAAAPPRPEGHDAASYAARLAVPRPDPFAGAGDLHLFWALRDDLPLLYEVLSRGRVERIGEWRALEASGAADRLFGAAVAARVGAAARVAECYLAAWRIGRGRRVDEAALRESDAVSDTFLPRLLQIAREADGDAAALLAVLDAGDDPRASRFRADQQARLRDYLEAERYLDARQRLDAAGLRARVLADAESSEVDPAAVQRLLDGLLRAIEP
jgi:DNA repair exonuclease SbcCD ATPase subunit